ICDILDHISEMFFVLDQDLCCIMWNRTAVEMTGVDIQSAIGQPLCKLLLTDSFRELEKIFRDVIVTGVITKSKTRCSMKGEPRNLDLTLIPEGTQISVLVKELLDAGKLDIPNNSQEDQAQLLAQSQDLRLLGQLTSGVAHEVRNPLNAISVVLEALFQDIGDVQEYRLYREHLFTHVERLKKLMQEILELGRPIEPSKVKTIDLEDLIREIVEIWHSSSPQNQFNIEIKTDNSADMRVKVNSMKMQQVFMNILDNAMQHSDSSKNILITISSEDGFCLTKVTDYGTGIKPEHLGKIFDPFFTTRKRGTGLGLSIVKHVIEVHGGRITIENNIVVPGCTVTIMLPRVHKDRKHTTLDTAQIERDSLSSYVL
ncbi:MAG TPA: ATP-binding protein, partial [Chitinispirillaceae bacterium]|nr:ATP-binding protein [Chitinispirillaceae bacterium]